MNERRWNLLCAVGLVAVAILVWGAAAWMWDESGIQIAWTDATEVLLALCLVFLASMLLWGAAVAAAESTKEKDGAEEEEK